MNARPLSIDFDADRVKAIAPRRIARVASQAVKMSELQEDLKEGVRQVRQVIGSVKSSAGQPRRLLKEDLGRRVTAAQSQ